MAQITVCRKEHFNAAHRLHNATLTAEENDQLFGKCNLPNFHGHNYELLVMVTGEIDPKTGYVMDMKHLSQIIRREVHERFDHRNLNLDTAEFKDLNPTAENIALKIHELLRPHIDAKLKLNIRLYETDRNFVEYPAIV